VALFLGHLDPAVCIDPDVLHYARIRSRYRTGQGATDAVWATGQRTGFAARLMIPELKLVQEPKLRNLSSMALWKDVSQGF